MAVRCFGDVHVMEQLGERQDFEAELSRLGYAHEDFQLHVRQPGRGPGVGGSIYYTVCVTSLATKRQNIYWSRRGTGWLAEFSSDLVSGHYGPPSLGRHALARAYPRPYLIAQNGQRK